MLKVVLDTNVLVSGIIASGYSARILDAARNEEIKIVQMTHTKLLANQGVYYALDTFLLCRGRKISE